MIAAATNDSAELYLYDAIGPEMWGGISAKMVKDALGKFRSVSEIVVRINSPGGDVFEGVAIFNLLDGHKARIRVVVDGVAASAASFIAMAGDEIEMPENSLMMIHEASGGAFGRAKDLEDYAVLMRKCNATIVRIYAKRTGNNPADIERWMDAETWMDADEAVEMGFATRVLETHGGPKNALNQKQIEWAGLKARIDAARVGAYAEEST